MGVLYVRGVGSRGETNESFIVFIITIFVRLDVQDLLASSIERPLRILPSRFPNGLHHVLVTCQSEERTGLT